MALYLILISSNRAIIFCSSSMASALSATPSNFSVGIGLFPLATSCANAKYSSFSALSLPFSRSSVSSSCFGSLGNSILPSSSCLKPNISNRFRLVFCPASFSASAVFSCMSWAISFSAVLVVLLSIPPVILLKYATTSLSTSACVGQACLKI